MRKTSGFFILIYVFLGLAGAISVFAQDAAPVAEQESDQKINDFSLSGFGERGKKTWELSGQSADIFEDVVKLKDITGKVYGKQEDLTLTAQRARILNHPFILFIYFQKFKNLTFNYEGFWGFGVLGF